MTNTIPNVPRKLLERVLNAGWGSETVNALDDLRGFLEESAAPAQPVSAQPFACQGTNCGTTTCEHSVECLKETAIDQGWIYEEAQPAGEVPIVVGVRVSSDGFGSYIADSAMGIGAALPGEVREPLMTVAQHTRIVAALQERAVVMPDALDRAFITGESCDGVYRVVIQSETLKEMQAVHRWLARLNAAPVQQVSAPDGWKLVPVEATTEMVSALKARISCTSRGGILNAGNALNDAIAAAPAAPAADGGLVEALEEWLADYDSCAANPDFEPFKHVAERVAKTRAALAAHRAKGVV